MTFAQTERREICRLFEQLGPDAPTLCEGWTTQDLAAHLWVREADPLAAPGIVVAPLAPLTEQRMAAARRRMPWPALVERLRQGPAPWSAFRLPGADQAANAVEYFVHVEDVRRAQPGGAEPREFAPAEAELLWQRVSGMGRLLFRSAPVGVTLNWEGRSAPVKPGPRTVTVHGAPGELLLSGFGRGDHARVELVGDPEDVAQLRQAHLGM